MMLKNNHTMHNCMESFKVFNNSNGKSSFGMIGFVLKEKFEDVPHLPRDLPDKEVLQIKQINICSRKIKKSKQF